MATRFAAVLAVLMTAMSLVPAQAGVIINSTRVVYPAKGREVTVRLDNKGQRPALVQVWMDNGDDSATPDKIDVPFILTPPIFRMDPGKQQAVRMAFVGQPLASDNESLFWFNMLEVPPKADAKDGEGNERNLLQFAFRTRIKVFYRPSGLPYDVNDAPSKLSWKLVSGGTGYALEVNNPSPYYVSFEKVELHDGARSYSRGTSENANDSMAAPGGTTRFPLPDLKAAPAAGAQVEFTTISDFGARIPGKMAVSL